MKIYVSVLAAVAALTGCAAQPDKQVMQAAQYKAIAASSVLADQCAIAGMMDLHLAAATSSMLERRTAEFQYDPARLQLEKQQAAARAQQEGALTQPTCNALAYEVVKIQEVRKNADNAEQERQRMALRMLMMNQSSPAVRPAAPASPTTVCNTQGAQTVCTHQ